VSISSDFLLKLTAFNVGSCADKVVGRRAL